MAQETSGSTPLFAVFLLSMISIFLIPYTLYRLFSDEDNDKEVVKTWSSKKDSRKPGLLAATQTRLRATFTLKVLIAWAIWLLLLWYIKVASNPLERFDPFEILQVSELATESDIKRAYRKLSLQYHPDKNPDPSAAEYFAEYITKAYKALTDDVSRENYKKYGHPDGPQALSISVALPEWFFSKDKHSAPAILLSLLLGGIVLPLGLAACYLGRTHRYTGPNEVMMETMHWYLQSPIAIKQYQQVYKLLDTLVCAMEFIPPQLPMPGDQGPALEQLLRSLTPVYPELRDRNSPFFKKRHQAIVKAHLLLLAHLGRVPVPPVLKKDLAYILQKTPRLAQEMFQVSILPRIMRLYGWLTPAIGCVELLQCIMRAVPLDEKRKVSGPARSSEGPAALLQLPHMTEEILKKLSKKKIKTLPELQALSRADRRMVLQGAGLAGSEVDEVETALSALPSVFVTARLFVEDAEGRDSGRDPRAIEEAVTCEVHVMLLRAAHQTPGFDPDSIKGTAARAYAPHFPFPRDEHWFFIVGDQSSGALLGFTRESLVEAEAVGARYASNWASKAIAGADPSGQEGVVLSAVAHGEGFESEDALVDALGQRVELKFAAPLPGKHDLTLFIMPDSWIGADRVMQFRLKTVEPTRAEREGRAAPYAKPSSKAKSSSKADGALLQKSEDSEVSEAIHGPEGFPPDDEEGDEMGSEGSEDESEEEEEHDWDSDEIGTEETDEEEEKPDLSDA